jgi:hypothetical protein
MVTKSLVLPGNTRVGLDERQGVLPDWPQLGQPYPKQASGRTEVRAPNSLLIHCALMPQHDVFQAQGGTGAEQGGDEGQ